MKAFAALTDGLALGQVKPGMGRRLVAERVDCCSANMDPPLRDDMPPVPTPRSCLAGGLLSDASGRGTAECGDDRSDPAGRSTPGQKHPGDRARPGGVAEHGAQGAALRGHGVRVSPMASTPTMGRVTIRPGTGKSKSVNTARPAVAGLLAPEPARVRQSAPVRRQSRRDAGRNVGGDPKDTRKYQFETTDCRHAMAEGPGFEPGHRVSPMDGLANRCLQPLGHPSGLRRCRTNRLHQLIVTVPGRCQPPLQPDAGRPDVRPRDRDRKTDDA